jgi:hypothetical protein
MKLEYFVEKTFEVQKLMFTSKWFLVTVSLLFGYFVVSFHVSSSFIESFLSFPMTEHRKELFEKIRGYEGVVARDLAPALLLALVLIHSRSLRFANFRLSSRVPQWDAIVGILQACYWGALTIFILFSLWNSIPLFVQLVIRSS